MKEFSQKKIDMVKTIHGFELRSAGLVNRMYIGIVLISNDVEEVSCRIGILSSTQIQASSDNSDARLIAITGGSLTKNEALGFFPEHKNLILSKWKT